MWFDPEVNNPIRASVWLSLSFLLLGSFSCRLCPLASLSQARNSICNSSRYHLLIFNCQRKNVFFFWTLPSLSYHFYTSTPSSFPVVPANISTHLIDIKDSICSALGRKNMLIYCGVESLSQREIRDTEEEGVNGGRKVSHWTGGKRTILRDIFN